LATTGQNHSEEDSISLTAQRMKNPASTMQPAG